MTTTTKKEEHQKDTESADSGNDSDHDSSDDDDDNNNNNNNQDSNLDSDDEEEDSSDDDEEEKNDDITFTSQQLLRPGKRTISWLCKEGQIPLARHRFEAFLAESAKMMMEQQQQHTRSTEPTEQEGANPNNRHESLDNSSLFYQQLVKEVFQVDRCGDKTYALHEILMGGTSCDCNALVMKLLDFVKAFPLEREEMLRYTCPPSHQRTALHWACWGNAPMEILQRLVQATPEAMLMRDKPSHGGRTPYEIFKRYFGKNEDSTERLHYLEKNAQKWAQHRLRLAVQMCVGRYFGCSLMLDDRRISTTNRQAQERKEPSACTATTKDFTPFDSKDRKRAKIKSTKAWFALSTVASLMQRQMTPLALHILGYMGGNAKKPSRSKRATTKRRASSNCGNQTAKRIKPR